MSTGEQKNLTQQEIDLVIDFYSRGNYHEAISQIKELNKKYPNVPLLFNIIGACYKALGQLNHAVQMFQSAVNLKPDYTEAYKNLGITFKDLSLLDDAVKSFEKAIEFDSNNAVLHFYLANIFEELDQFENSISHHQRAIKINPKFSESFNNLGNVLTKNKLLNDAIENYQYAIEINPNFPEAYNNLGNAYKDLGKLQIAIKSYKKALEINQNFSEALYNLGVVQQKLRLLEDSIVSFNNAIKINPRFAEAHNSLGSSLNSLGYHIEAMESCNKAIAIDSNYAEAYNIIGNIYKDQGKPNNAIRSYKKAITLKSNYAEAHSNLGSIHRDRKQLEKALLYFEKAHLLKPDMSFILGDILQIKMRLCKWDNLSNQLIELRSRITNNEKVVSPFSLLGLIDDPKLQKKASEIYANYYYPKSDNLPNISVYPNHKKIRIGYFSADFKQHPVATLTAELYEMHDREHFEVYAFSFGNDTNDEMNLRIKSGVDYFHDVRETPLKDLVLLSRFCEIDIAIDLGGFTKKSRTEIFAMSVAPIQLSYIGYLGTLGANYYDYLIADQIMIPMYYQKYYSEKIIYLPSFQVNDSKEKQPDIVLTRAEIGLPKGGFVFCCFNNTYKITPAVLDLWTPILKSVSGSVLLLVADNEIAKDNLIKEFNHRGIEPSRLIFGGRFERPEYLARYHLADLFLDTNPYNAGTTASDALRMGLPVLTLLGKAYPSRMAASIVNAVNLPELITHSEKEYVSLAIQIANNPDKLKKIKEKLINNLSTAPLFDTKRFTTNLETAYKNIYEGHRQGQEPDHIIVEQESF
ncbi:MAG: tetratricopeptide repeat protein [Candidatus Pseudothioglobus sp.]